jgi:tryptophan-rich sensory protein
LNEIETKEMKNIYALKRERKWWDNECFFLFFWTPLLYQMGVSEWLLFNSDTLSWFQANKSLLFLLSAACLVEKQQIPIL